MSRNVATRALAVLLASPALAAAGQEPPPLTPPTLTAPALTGPAESPKPATEPPKAVTESPKATIVPPTTRIPESRPVLAIPGVTAPARPRPRPADSAPLDLATPRELPAFDTPREMLDAAPTAAPRQIPSQVDGGPPPLESIPLDPSNDSRLNLSPRPSTQPSPTPGRSTTRPNSPPPAPTPDPMRRPPGFLGRLFPAPYATARPAPNDRRPVTVEPRSDPAADAALQRRVERQVREAVGDRVRSYEVRVVDRNVTIRVRAARFWQKRSIRHTLETLPGLNGYHARVDVVE